MNGPLAKRLAAEALGTSFLLMAVVGSGIMAARLSGGNAALALLALGAPAAHAAKPRSASVAVTRTRCKPMPSNGCAPRT